MMKAAATAALAALAIRQREELRQRVVQGNRSTIGACIMPTKPNQETVAPAAAADATLTAAAPAPAPAPAADPTLTAAAAAATATATAAPAADATLTAAAATAAAAAASTDYTSSDDSDGSRSGDEEDEEDFQSADDGEGQTGSNAAATAAAAPAAPAAPAAAAAERMAKSFCDRILEAAGQPQQYQTLLTVFEEIVQVFTQASLIKQHLSQLSRSIKAGPDHGLKQQQFIKAAMLYLPLMQKQPKRIQVIELIQKLARAEAATTLQSSVRIHSAKKAVAVKREAAAAARAEAEAAAAAAERMAKSFCDRILEAAGQPQQYQTLLTVFEEIVQVFTQASLIKQHLSQLSLSIKAAPDHGLKQQKFIATANIYLNMLPAMKKNSLRINKIIEGITKLARAEAEAAAAAAERMAKSFCDRILEAAGQPQQYQTLLTVFQGLHRALETQPSLIKQHLSQLSQLSQLSRSIKAGPDHGLKQQQFIKAAMLYLPLMQKQPKRIQVIELIQKLARAEAATTLQSSVRIHSAKKAVAVKREAAAQAKAAADAQAQAAADAQAQAAAAAADAAASGIGSGSGSLFGAGATAVQSTIPPVDPEHSRNMSQIDGLSRHPTGQFESTSAIQGHNVSEAEALSKQIANSNAAAASAAAAAAAAAQVEKQAAQAKAAADAQAQAAAAAAAAQAKAAADAQAQAAAAAAAAQAKVAAKAEQATAAAAAAAQVEKQAAQAKAAAAAQVEKQAAQAKVAAEAEQAAVDAAIKHALKKHVPNSAAAENLDPQALGRSINGSIRTFSLETHAAEGGGGGGGAAAAKSKPAAAGGEATAAAKSKLAAAGGGAKAAADAQPIELIQAVRKALVEKNDWVITPKYQQERTFTNCKDAKSFMTAFKDHRTHVTSLSRYAASAAFPAAANETVPDINGFFADEGTKKKTTTLYTHLHCLQIIMDGDSDRFYTIARKNVDKLISTLDPDDLYEFISLAASRPKIQLDRQASMGVQDTKSCEKLRRIQNLIEHIGASREDCGHLIRRLNRLVDKIALELATEIINPQRQGELQRGDVSNAQAIALQNIRDRLDQPGQRADILRKIIVAATTESCSGAEAAPLRDTGLEGIVQEAIQEAAARAAARGAARGSAAAGSAAAAKPPAAAVMSAAAAAVMAAPAANGVAAASGGSAVRAAESPIRHPTPENLKYNSDEWSLVEEGVGAEAGAAVNVNGNVDVKVAARNCGGAASIFAGGGAAAVTFRDLLTNLEREYATHFDSGTDSQYSHYPLIAKLKALEDRQLNINIPMENWDIAIKPIHHSNLEETSQHITRLLPKREVSKQATKTRAQRNAEKEAGRSGHRI